MSDPKPIIIRGVEYPSKREAARALGVSRNSLAHAISTGALEYLGTGERPVMRVTVRGVTYDSASDAARALGVAENTVYKAAAAGRTDGLGVGMGGNRSRKSGRPVKPVTIAGLCFSSMSEAARALGVDKKTISVTMRTQGKRAMARLVRLAEEYKLRLLIAALDRQAADERAARRLRGAE